MTDDAHLHNAAATLRDILRRRQPQYRWDVEVLPRPRVPADPARAATVEGRECPRAVGADDRDGSERDRD